MPLAVFFVLFTGLWTAISFFIARQSGWRGLAGRYRAGAAPDGERRRWVSAGLDGVSFRSSLNVVAGPAGLHLRPVLLFRPFMPPLLIPWADIRFLELTSTLGLQRAKFRLGASEGPVLSVGRRLAEMIGARLVEPQRAHYKDAALAAPPAPLRKRLLIGAGLGLGASGLFYALLGRGPHGAPLPAVLFPAILVLVLFLQQDR